MIIVRFLASLFGLVIAVVAGVERAVYSVAMGVLIFIGIGATALALATHQHATLHGAAVYFAWAAILFVLHQVLQAYLRLCTPRRA